MKFLGWSFVYVCIPEVAIIRILKVSYEVARVIHGCAFVFTRCIRAVRVNGRSPLLTRVYAIRVIKMLCEEFHFFFFSFFFLFFLFFLSFSFSFVIEI